MANSWNNLINSNKVTKFLWSNLYARFAVIISVIFIWLSIFFFNKEKKYEEGIAFTDEQAKMILEWIPTAEKTEDLWMVNEVVRDWWNRRKVFAYNKDISFQEPATPIAEGIINFHHDLMFYLFIILFFVVFMLFRCIVLFSKEKVNKIYVVTHAPVLEIIWTIIPAIILVVIAIPSFALLYSMDEIVDPAFTVKVIGHQWYWTYELTDPDTKSVLSKVIGLTEDYDNMKDVIKALPDLDVRARAWTDPQNTGTFQVLNNLINTEQKLEKFVNFFTNFYEVKTGAKEDTAEGISTTLTQKWERNPDSEKYLVKTHPFLGEKLLDDFNLETDTFNELDNDFKTNIKKSIDQNLERIFKTKLRFDSYLVPYEDNTSPARRHEYLLKVDNPLHVPVHLVVRVLVTSADVLHSWAVPSLGVKIDACPGRLNETSFYLNYASTFYGQCSEICGINHGFMPIVVHGHDFWEGREIPEELIDQYVLLYLYLYKYMRVQKELGII